MTLLDHDKIIIPQNFYFHTLCLRGIQFYDFFSMSLNNIKYCGGVIVVKDSLFQNIIS